MQGCVTFFPIEIIKTIQRVKRFYPNSIKTIGNCLRVKRLDDGLYQKDLGKMFGVRTKTIFGWENKTTNPPTKYLPRICNYLNYCPTQPVKHFGQQFKLWRQFTLGLGVIETAKAIGIGQSCLVKIEKTGKVNFKRTYKSLLEFLAKREFEISEEVYLQPKFHKGKGCPRFNQIS